jgi:uncharacterized repeat protein (TIGR03803 family)
VGFPVAILVTLDKPALRALPALVSPAQTFTTLVNFNGINGLQPSYIALVQGTDGNLYGTTSAGGVNSNCQLGCGTIFEISPAGMLTTLHSFDYTDGEYPYAGLLLTANGNFYGTTYKGGSATCNCGTIFEITSAGALTTLHRFNDPAGAYPIAWLLRPRTATSTGRRPEAGRVRALARYTNSPLGARSRSCTASMNVTAAPPKRGWF